MCENIERHLLRVRRAGAVARPVRAAFACTLSLIVSSAFAQATLGELLDAGATLLTPDDFRREVVQRTLVGLAAAGGKFEIMYGNSGLIAGVGAPPENIMSPIKEVGVQGEWFADNEGRICTTLRFGAAAPAIPQGPTIVPRRCQYWFKASEAYFLSDYDSDRGAKVLRRTVKQ